jgi:2-polyprenyl-3-methyl-5-hydroxy-6-metoxy-1,4-benzoquinol methylase
VEQSLVKRQNCPLCGASELSHFITAKDHLVSGADFQLDKCSNCGLVVTNPFPDETHIGAYYESEEYTSHSESKAGLIQSLYFLVQGIALRSKFRIVRRHVSGSKILDYGCGTGAFLKYLKDKGWDTMGLETSHTALVKARKKGLEVFQAREDLIPDVKYDAITLWHVLEHLPNPLDTLSYLKSRLTDQGMLIVAVPNLNSYDARFYGEHWAAYDVPRHLFHYSPITMGRLVLSQGLKIVRTYPMVFDSFYVSMLSEKYKSGHPRMLSAFYRGLISNVRALGSRNYSSLIYILSKA